MKRYVPYVAIVLAMLFWSAAGIAIKQALVVFTPLMLIVLRFSMAVTLMLLTGLVCRVIDRRRGAGRETGLALEMPSLRDWPLFVLTGFFQPFLYFLLETLCYRALTSPTVAETLLSTSPILAPLFAVVLLRERVSWATIAGIVVSTAGVVLLVTAGSSRFAIGDPKGLLWAFLAVSSAVMYTIMLRRIPSHYNTLTVVLCTQFVSLLLFVPLWLLTDGGMAGSQADAAAWHRAIGAVCYLAVFCSVAAFMLFCYSVREIGVTRANAFNNIRPVFTALLMWSLMGEHLPWLKLVGIGIIIGGLFLCQKGGK
ncbi:MAG: EamA family transporter [Paludibacteraceae bacterium]|nr:EamA family transporter [Paludibacteraceae bacterium]